MLGFYGVFLDIKGRRCAVFGGDEHEAERKVRYLLDCGAEVVFFAPEDDVSVGLEKLASEGKAEWVRRKYQAGDLCNVWLAIVADTSNQTVNEAISKEAESNNVLLNVMDVTHLCNFIAPALVHVGPVTTAISTGGASPALARRLREEMSGENCRCMRWARSGRSLEEARRRIRSKGIVVCPEKWQGFMTEEWLSEALEGNESSAIDRIVEQITSIHCEPCAPIGRCSLLAEGAETSPH